MTLEESGLYEYIVSFPSATCTAYLKKKRLCLNYGGVRGLTNIYSSSGCALEYLLYIQSAPPEPRTHNCMLHRVYYLLQLILFLVISYCKFRQGWQGKKSPQFRLTIVDQPRITKHALYGSWATGGFTRVERPYHTLPSPRGNEVMERRRRPIYSPRLNLVSANPLKALLPRIYVSREYCQICPAPGRGVRRTAAYSPQPAFSRRRFEPFPRCCGENAPGVHAVKSA